MSEVKVKFILVKYQKRQQFALSGLLPGHGLIHFKVTGHRCLLNLDTV